MKQTQAARTLNCYQKTIFSPLTTLSWMQSWPSPSPVSLLCMKHVISCQVSWKHAEGLLTEMQIQEDELIEPDGQRSFKTQQCGFISIWALLQGGEDIQEARAEDTAQHKGHNMVEACPVTLTACWSSLVDRAPVHPAPSLLFFSRRAGCETNCSVGIIKTSLILEPNIPIVCV